MEGVPKFKSVKETPHGNHLERLREPEPDLEILPEQELTESQQEALRAALSSLKGANVPSGQKKS